MLSKFSNLSLEDFTTLLLRFISALQPLERQLSPVQLEVLKKTLLLPDKYRYRLFTYATKKYVASLFPMSVSNLNNRIYELIEKKYLYRDEDKVIYVNPALLQAVDLFKKQKSITLTYVFEGSKDPAPSPTDGRNTVDR